MIRPPAVAGKFYDLEPERLKKQIKSCFSHKLGSSIIQEEDFKACVVPHAGYIYSGPVASNVYSKIKKANYVIIGPNHRPSENNYSIMTSGEWKTPLGGVKINENFSKNLLENCPLLKNDPLSHKPEHSIEVQIPFLQYRFDNDFSFVPILIGNRPDHNLLEECKIVGDAIYKTIKDQKEEWIVIASSDFSHYVPQEQAERFDKWIIESILKLDEEELFNRILQKNVSVCGFVGIAVSIVISKKLGAKKGELLKYATSGDIINDKTSVVGYGSIIIK
jgi:hypothetical protein